MTTEQDPRPDPKVAVVAAEGPAAAAANSEGRDEDVRSLVEQPAKVMRIGTMVKQLLDEVRSAPLDDAARARLAEIHERALHELEEGLSPDLATELRQFTLPFTDAPTDAELRIAQAQLVGWLEGLFHGIQTAVVIQQMTSQEQLQQMRRALPAASVPGLALHPDGEEDDPRHAPGQYL